MLDKNTFPIKHNDEYTCVITNASLRDTAIDKAIDLSITVYLKDGKEISMKDVVYINDSYAKKIAAIFASVGENIEYSGFWEGDYKNALQKVLNKPLQILFKEKPNGYINPYTYKRPNSTISEKWLKRGFGEQEGKIHDTFMSEAQNNAINANHMEYLLDKDNEHDRKVNEPKSEDNKLGEKLIIQKLDSISRSNQIMLQALLELQQNYTLTNKILDAINESKPEDFNFDSEPSDEKKGGQN